MDCEICFENFDLQGRRPKVLPCGHSACIACLRGLHEQRCPTCRKGFRGVAGNLPDNYTVMALIREKTDKRPETGSGPNFWCMECVEVAEEDCVNEHAVISLKAALRKHMLQLQVPQLADDVQKQLQELNDVDASRAMFALQMLSGPNAPSDLVLRAVDGSTLLSAALQRDPNGPGAGPGPSSSSASPLSLSGRLLKILALVLAKDGRLQQDRENKRKVKLPSPVAVSSPVAVKVEVRASIDHIHLFVLSLQTPDQGQDEKKEMLERVERQGVRRLTKVWCHTDPDFVQQLLRKAAPHLEELQVLYVLKEHVMAVNALPRLRRLHVDGADRSLREEREPPVLAPLPAHHVGLRWLRVSGLPRETTFSLVRGHAATLEHLWVNVGTPGDAGWPDSCSDLPALLGQCGLRKLRRLVMRRTGTHATESALCDAQKADVKDVLPGTNVFCSKCDKVPEDEL